MGRGKDNLRNFHTFQVTLSQQVVILYKTQLAFSGIVDIFGFPLFRFFFKIGALIMCLECKTSCLSLY